MNDRLTCKFHPRRHAKLLFVSFERGCDCNDRPMFISCKECALALACTSLPCKVCNVAPGDILMRDINDGILFPTEEMV